MRLFQEMKAVLAAMLLLVASATAALAVEAAATVQLNVRTGPGTSFGVIDTLAAGEVVQVIECQESGWCYIDQSGPNGWVSSNYLTATPTAGGGSGSDCQLKLTIGPSGPKLELVCDTDPVAVIPAPIPIPVPLPGVAQACFYRDANFSGANFCYGVGTLNALNPAFNDRITSVKLQGGARAQVCSDPNMTGSCRNVLVDIPSFGPAMNDKISSLVVFTGSPPAPLPTPGPVTHSTGAVTLQSSFSVNLDNGTVGGAGTDVWYRAITPVNKRLQPINGAKMALGDGSNRGFAGCSAAAFTTNPIPFAALPVGTYVCVKTEKLRISQFRVNSFTPTSIKIGYTTWAK